MALTDENLSNIEIKERDEAALGKQLSGLNIYRYPQDLGSAQRGHYMIFFVRQRDGTNFPASERGATVNENVGSDLKYSSSNFILQRVGKSGKSLFGTIGRSTRTNESIVLYMPDTLNFDSRQNYSDLSPGTTILGQAILAGPALLEKFKAGDFKGLFSSAVNSGAGRLALQRLAENFGLGGDALQLGLYSAFGQVLNPMIEVIYASPQPREFQFEFFFYPKSKAEAQQVLKIINLFKFHSSPEMGSTGMLIPPSEFDIMFCYKGKENPNIPRIGTCVLKNVQTNYAPKGFAAYETESEIVEEGGTGMPVAITMSLQFSETTFITKEDFIKSSESASAPAAISPASVSGKTDYVALYNSITKKDDSSNNTAKRRKQKQKVNTVKQGTVTSTGVDAGIAAGNQKNYKKKSEDNRYLTKYGITSPDLGGGAGG